MSDRILPNAAQLPARAHGREVSALRESEERFRTAFVQAPLPQAFIDAEARFVAANPSFCAFVGYDAEELLTRRVQDITHTEDWDHGNEEGIASLMRGEADRVVLEKRYVRKDGGLAHARVFARAVRDDAGTTRFIHGIVLDITAQRQAEAELAASEARLRALLEHTGDVVVLVGSNGVVRAVASSSGDDRTLRAGGSVFDFLDPVDAGRFRAALSEVVLQDVPRRLQVRGVCDGGERRNWDVRLANRLRDPVLEAVVATFRDVTPQVRAEELAEGEAALLRMLLAGESRERSLDALARMVERAWPGLRATVLLTDGDNRVLRHVAGPSMPASFLEAIDGLPLRDGAGACGTAAFLDTAVVVEDVRRDALMADYVALFEPIGVRSCWSLPIHDGEGRVIGTFALYGLEVAAPTVEQWRLMERVGHLASLLIAGQPKAGPLRGRNGSPDGEALATVAKLTERERLVLRFIAMGHTNQEIADKLHVSVRTVESHRAKVSAKADAVSRADLVRLALAGGLLSTEVA